MAELFQLDTAEEKTQFNPERLTLIRERRGLSVTQLSRLSKVADRTIRNSESGKTTPSPDIIVRLARTLNVPTGFFDLDSVERLGDKAASFRRASKLPAYQKKSALAGGAITCEIYDLMNTYFAMANPKVPDLSEHDPETAAETLRVLWGLGSGPAPNMVHLLESKGVFVTALASDYRKIDAFSFWRQDQPFVVLNTMKSGERGRTDAAHELGHLVLHQNIETTTKQQEAEADTFAAAFLVPRNSIISNGWRNPPIKQVLEHKKAWKVSATLFVVRLNETGLLTSWSYRSLMIELTQQGYRTGEPDGIERETSAFFQNALTELRKENITIRHLAQQLQLKPNDLRQHLFTPTLA